MNDDHYLFEKNLRACVKTAPTYIPGRSIESIKKEYGDSIHGI